MKHGHYADNELPKANKELNHTTNSLGYRCPEFSPLPVGGKNVVVLGCSHTFGVGLSESQTWVKSLEKLFNNKRLRFWNLGQPGASPDKCVRILYGCEKILFPKIIIMCWPAWSRRERLEQDPISLTGDDPLLKQENDHTDRNNFLRCVFQTEKFAQYNQAKIFHCFAQDVYDIPGNTNVLDNTSIRSCWPEWDNHRLEGAKREHITEPDLAADGIHYGIKHHQTFAQKFYDRFRTKLK